MMMKAAAGRFLPFLDDRDGARCTSAPFPAAAGLFSGRRRRTPGVGNAPVEEVQPGRA